jgi:hypothetical protein
MSFEARRIGRTRIRASHGLVFRDAHVTGEDFSGRKLRAFTAIESRFERCRFEGMRIESAKFGSGLDTSRYDECSFDKSRITGAGTIGRARFEGCSFRDVDLRHWLALESDFVNCTFSGRVTQAVFTATRPQMVAAPPGRERNVVKGNDFIGAELRDVAFRGGIDLRDQELPSGAEYLLLEDGSAAVQRLRAAAVRLEDLELRKRILGLVRAWESELEDGQRQLFLQRTTYRRALRDAVDFAWPILVCAAS